MEVAAAAAAPLRVFVKVRDGAALPYYPAPHHVVGDLLDAVHGKVGLHGTVRLDMLTMYQSESMQEALEPDTLLHGISGGRTAKTALYVDYPDTEESAAKRQRTGDPAEATELRAILQAKRDAVWLNVEHARPIYIRTCYEKMADLLMNRESLSSLERLTYVVKGTPGIGKTTMLDYLLWRCTRDDSPFTIVLFATARGAFVASKSGGVWQSKLFDESKVVVGEGGQAVGLVDVTPEGAVEVRNRTVMKLNQQGPCSSYGLHRLVVAASAGSQLGQLIDKDRDGRIPEVLWLPAWQPEHTRLWAQKVLECGDDALNSMESVCGLGVPRLVKVCSESETRFNEMLARFIGRLSGKNVADRQSSAKDAHTMLLTQPSKELCEAETDEEHLPGHVIGFVSRSVADEVSKLLSSGDSFKQVVRMVPKVVGYIFEHMVLKALVSQSGLELVEEGGKHSPLKFSGEGPLLCRMKGMRIGVLYHRQWGADYPSIDCCGVPVGDDRFFLIQVSTGQKHRRVQKDHIDTICVPQDAKSTVVLYIISTTPSSITLFNGQNPLTSEEVWKSKRAVEKVVSAPSILDGFPQDVKQRFEPSCHS